MIRFLLAALLAISVHCAAVAVAVIIWLLPAYSPPELIEVYGDSDREGFPVAAIAVNPGAWREGDEHTPGGDGAPEAMERDQRPELTPAPPEPRVDLPATTVGDSKATSPTETSPGPSQLTGPQLPGEPGGAHMAIGTPSAGGRVGSKSGVRMASGATPPIYPQAAREAGIEGRVIIWLHISATGEVLEAKVHSSSGHQILDDTALRWAQKQKFIPAKVGERKVEAEVTKPVNFYLY